MPITCKTVQSMSSTAWFITKKHKAMSLPNVVFKNEQRYSYKIKCDGFIKIIHTSDKEVKAVTKGYVWYDSVCLTSHVCVSENVLEGSWQEGKGACLWVWGHQWRLRLRVGRNPQSPHSGRARRELAERRSFVDASWCPLSASSLLYLEPFLSFNLEHAYISLLQDLSVSRFSWTHPLKFPTPPTQD